MQIFIPFDPKTLAAQLRSSSAATTPETADLIAHAATKIENGKALLAVQIVDDGSKYDLFPVTEIASLAVDKVTCPLCDRADVQMVLGKHVMPGHLESHGVKYTIDCPMSDAPLFDDVLGAGQ